MPAADFATNPDYGCCPVCGRSYQLTGKGRVRKHWKRDAAGRPVNALNNEPCPGSGRAACTCGEGTKTLHWSNCSLYTSQSPTGGACCGHSEADHAEHTDEGAQ